MLDMGGNGGGGFTLSLTNTYWSLALLGSGVMARRGRLFQVSLHSQRMASRIHGEKMEWAEERGERMAGVGGSWNAKKEIGKDKKKIRQNERGNGRKAERNRDENGRRTGWMEDKKKE